MLKMSKGKAYYFKFDATEWLAATSKVQTLNYEEKGFFIDLCAMLILQKGKIKNDEMLHRQLRISEGKLSNLISLLSKSKLLVSKDGFLSVKFISEAIGEMKKKSMILSENGRKGGRPKSKKKQTYNNDKDKNNHKNNHKNKNKEISLSSPPQSPPGGGIPEPSKSVPDEKKDLSSENTRKDSFMKKAWLESGKPLEEYERRTAVLPDFTLDDMNCIMSFEPNLDKAFFFDLKRAKALLGPMGFSEEIHMLKCRFLEGAAENPRAYFNTLIKNAITNLQL